MHDGGLTGNRMRPQTGLWIVVGVAMVMTSLAGASTVEVHLPLQVCELIFNDSEIVEYFHLESRGEAPVLVAFPQLLHPGLEPRGYSIKLVRGTSGAAAEAFQLTTVHVQPKRIVAEFEYPPEGLRGRFVFVNRLGKWSISERRLWEISYAEPPDELSMLIEMVREADVNERPLDLSQPFLLAAFVGEEFLVSTLKVDPRRPDTLISHFDMWQVTARLQLLMDYARWQTSLKTPRTYVGFDPAWVEEFQRYDAEADARIARLGEDTSLEGWSIFVSAYDEFLREAERAASQYRERAGDLNPWQLSPGIGIDGIGRRYLREPLQSVHIKPEHVAREMMRLLAEKREKIDLHPGTEFADEDLFYHCGNGQDASVQATLSHPMFDSFTKVYEADSSDQAATRIKEAYTTVVAKYRTWLIANPTAPTIAQYEKVQSLAGEYGLIEKIKAYSP